jgi:hypothetical protein
MPAKLQKIYKDWAVFDQGITLLKNDIKEERKCTYSVLIWLGSKEPPQKILDSCILEWDETRANGSTIKMTYTSPIHL